MGTSATMSSFGNPVDTAIAGRKTTWFADHGIVTCNLILCLSLVSSYATGYDGSMMNGLQSLDTWNAYFHDPTASTLALLNCIQNVGQLAMMPFCALICDRYGRRAGLLIGASIMLVGVVLQGAAQNNGMFVAARGILGTGLVLNITAAPLLVLELAFPTQRAPLVSIYNSLYGLGQLTAAWITFGTFRIANDWGWRIPSLLQSLSSIIQLALCFLIVESPRWLVWKDRIEEARAIIVRYHGNGSYENPLVDVEMAEMRESLKQENEARMNTSFFSFFSSRGNLRRFFIVLAVGFFSQWSGNGLISYYLTLILDSIGYTSEYTQTLINALLAVWSLVWGIAFSLIVNRFGRRTLFLISTAGCLMVYITWTALEATYENATDLEGEGSSGVARGVLAMIFLYNFMFSIGWGPLQVTYVVEILPQNLRAKGLVLYNFFVALALIFNQYANPIGVTNSKWKYYITYDVWLFVELVVVYFLFVETGNRSLEETAAVLDGVEAQTQLVEAAAKELKASNEKDETAVQQTEL